MARYKQKSFPRHERKLQVVTQFRQWQENGDTKPRTMGAIARALGMTPANTFRDVLLEMVEEGDLAADPPLSEGGNTVRHYSLVKTLITEKFLRRTISVSKRGVAVGQLEMFS
jgi:hypothetical protein